MNTEVIDLTRLDDSIVNGKGDGRGSRTLQDRSNSP